MPLLLLSKYIRVQRSEYEVDKVLYETHYTITKKVHPIKIFDIAACHSKVVEMLKESKNNERV